MVDLRIQGGPFFLIFADEFQRFQDFFFLMGETAEVEVAAALDDFPYSVIFCLGTALLLDFLPIVPPFPDGLKMFRLHGLSLGEVLVALRHIKAIEPDSLRGMRAVEKEQVGRDARIGRKHASRQTDDGMQIEFGQQFLLDVGLGVVRAEQEPVWQNNRSPSFLFETVHDDAQEQVCGLGVRQVIGEMVLDAWLFAAAIRGDS